MKGLKRNRFLVVYLVLLISSASCEKDGPYSHFRSENKFEGNIYDYLKSEPEHFKYMLFVLEKAGLTDVLKSDTLTYFAPTDVSLFSAIDKFNVFRHAQGLSAVTLNDIDSSSWRYILAAYLFPGTLEPENFAGRDGLSKSTLALREMHGDLIKHNATGAKELGSQTIKFSYPNHSKYTKDWQSAFVSTPEIRTSNGIIYIIENRHVLGFTFFASKALEPQNIYSETKTFASGQITSPTGDIKLWSFYIKKLTAVNENTIETEAISEDTYPGLGMWLTVLPNDSVIVQPAPWSGIKSLRNSGPCYFDRENLLFVLNYAFDDLSGTHTVDEIIRYIALRTN